MQIMHFDGIILIEIIGSLREDVAKLQNESILSQQNIDDLKQQVEALTEELSALRAEYRKTATERAIGLRSATDL
ncbi:hypothetical protein [Methylobacterium sp. 190mf]|uniref:hypothetical protein n=1 Tax=Methylobacterium sp. 190mf TaxID=1761798 RepID=UPI0011B06633|nr:hypothetical protein [Methylobacterium sp. 190mf]